MVILYTYLAACGAAIQADDNNNQAERPLPLMTRMLKNVVMLDIGGHCATITFVERDLGDVLISFESEVNNIRQQYGAYKYYLIVLPRGYSSGVPSSLGG